MKRILLTILGRLSLIGVLMFLMATAYSQEKTPAVKQSLDNSKSVYATWLMIWIQKHPNTASWFTEENVNKAQIYLNGVWRGWDWADNTFVDDAMSKLHAAGINVLVLDLTNGWGWQESVVKEIQKRCVKYDMKVCVAENSTGVLSTFEDHASCIYEKFAGPNAAYGDTYFKKDGKPLIVCYAIREWYNSYINSTGVNRSKFSLVWASGEDAEVNKWGWQLVPQVGALPSKESMYVSPSVKYSPADKNWRSHLASLDYNFTLARLNSAKYIIVGSYDDIPERNGWLPAKTDSVIPSCQFRDIYGNISIDAYYNRVKEWTKGTPGSVAGGLIEDGAYRFLIGMKQVKVFNQDGIVGRTLKLSAKTEEMPGLFYLYHLGDNEYRIVALSGGLSLEAHADNTISQEYDTPENSQRWTIEKSNSGNFTVKNKQFQRYLSSEQTDNVLLNTNPKEWIIEAGLTISGKGYKAIVAQ